MGHVLHAYHPALKLPEELNELAGLYHSTLDGQRALLLLDNALDAAQVAPLLPPTTCLLLVTSRRRFSLPGLTELDLDTLPEGDAVRLLKAIAGKKVGKFGKALARLCGYLPLALRAAASLLRQRPDLTAEALCRRLEDAARRLELADPARGDLSVRAVLRIQLRAAA